MNYPPKGITIAGNILTDIVKMIDSYPKPSMLVNIRSMSRAVGGCVPNTAIDLATIDPALKVSAVGLCGDDEYGRFALDKMNACGIDTSRVSVRKDGNTGFSDVMTDIRTGERTFFHLKGVNSDFVPEDVKVDELDCDIFHIGYILLLDGMDACSEEYGTELARLLCEVQKRGIKTSFDVVSDSSGRFAEKVIPALKYADYAIMNEIEVCGVTGLDPRCSDGSPDTDNIGRSMEELLKRGVRDRVIVHCPEYGYMLTSYGRFTASPSMKIAPEKIVGTVGAGDAFCAGCLYGLEYGMEDEDLLTFAASAALCNLTAADSVSGMRGKDEILKIRDDGGIF